MQKIIRQKYSKKGRSDVIVLIFSITIISSIYNEFTNKIHACLPCRGATWEVCPQPFL
jgi:hypothetical protein